MTTILKDEKKQERFEKLPKWAQEEILSLKREVEDLKKELVLQQDSLSPTRIKWGYGKSGGKEAYGYVPDHETIFFNINEFDYSIRVSFDYKDKKTVYINGDRPLKIKPQSCNAIKVCLEDD